jgi:hypothetical protein
MDMNAVAKFNTRVSIESKVPATALFSKLREILRINPALEAVTYATELYFDPDDDFIVQVNMEFGEEDGRKPLFEDGEDEDYVDEHTPYAEITLSTDTDYKTKLGGAPKDLHSLVLSELSEWLDDHSIEWGYYSDADKMGRWISGEFPVRFGNPDKADLDELAVGGIS